MNETNHPARRLRHGDRPTEPLTFEDAAANKAAEEGGLPALPKAKMLVGQHLDSLHVLYSAEQVRDAQRAAIAADRASRQVANKAEVDLSSLFRSDWSELGMLPASEGTYVDFEHVEALLATPPATTGASTAETIDTPEFRERLRGLGATFSAHGDAYKLLVGYVNRMHAIAIEREVAAQAGQVAVPANLIWDAITRLENRNSTIEERFAVADSLLAIAPSPAKESK